MFYIINGGSHLSVIYFPLNIRINILCLGIQIDVSVFVKAVKKINIKYVFNVILTSIFPYLNSLQSHNMQPLC